MLDDFKKFALRGNVVDLAIGVIIGAAFGAIVQSLVGDVIMPMVGAVTGGLDFSNHFLPLSHQITAGTLAEAKSKVLYWLGVVFSLSSLTLLSSLLYCFWRSAASTG